MKFLPLSHIPLKLFYLIVTFFFHHQIYAQNLPNISLEDIWKEGKYFAASAEAIKFANDDQYFYELAIDTVKNKPALYKKRITDESQTLIADAEYWVYDGKPLAVNDFQFSPDEQYILLETATEHIYRRSSRSEYFIFNVKDRTIKPLSLGGKQGNPEFSKDGRYIAFTRNNNLHLYTMANATEIAITTDGIADKIINGSTDWVYEEEFEFTKGFFWSPDARYIAYYRFDESLVPQYNMQTWGGQLYPQNYQYKYPKAGEKNATVSIHTYQLINRQTNTVPLVRTKEFYVPRIKWTEDNDIFAITLLNRAQSHLEILHASASKNTVSKVFEDKNATYIEVNDYLTYLKNNSGFILSSERSGYRHLYHYNMAGKLVTQVTKGSWEVDKFLGIDAQANIYFTSTESGEMERQLYTVAITGKNKRQLTIGRGVHEISMSPNLKFYTDQMSTFNSPATISLCDNLGKELRRFENNETIKTLLAAMELGKTSFFKFKTEGNIYLNAYMIEPIKRKVTGKYPVLIYVYGGPGSQEVKDEWAGPNYAWFQMLAQMGYGVMCVDGRGTGGRGEVFKKITQFNLGKLETEDVIAAAKYLGSLPNVDKNRIGIFGWSFGGYLASLAMTVGSDYFKMGIAVAPVISWRFYDTIYTERFLGQPSTNPNGYDLNSPLSHAEKLKGPYLLVHGTADDNVHLQNAVEMERALIKEGKQFTSFHYPDKNHGIYGGNTRLHLYQMMTDFIKKNL